MLNAGLLATTFSRLAVKLFPNGYWKEFKKIFNLAWCTIATSFFQFFLQSISIIMCGHLSKFDLDSAALANTLINVLGISIGMGLTTACDTLFSQAYGSNNPKKIGIYLQKGILINILFLLGLYALHINMEPILLAIGQEPIIAQKTAVYLRLFMPGLLFEFIFLLLARYLQNQNILLPSLIIAIIGNIVNALSQYVCIYVFNFGYEASAICQASSYCVMVIIKLLYIVIFKKYESTWDGWSRECVVDWSSYMSLAVPGLFMVALEDWSFEICTILAGTMGPDQLGAQSIIFQLEAISFVLPLGMSIAVNIRIGHLLGAGKPDAAANCYRVALTMIWFTATVMAIIFISAKDYLPKLFSNDGLIISKAAAVLPIMGAFQYCDGTAAVSCGTLRGCGRQVLGASMLFVGYYVLALPTGISLAFFAKLEILGLWCGQLVGVGVEAIVFLIIITRTNWKKIAIDISNTNQGQESTKYEYDSTVMFTNTSDEESASEVALLLGKNDGTRSPGKKSRRERPVISSRACASGYNANDIKQPLEESLTVATFTPRQWRYLFVKRIGTYGAVLLVLTVAIILHFNWTPPEASIFNNTQAPMINLTNIMDN